MPKTVSHYILLQKITIFNFKQAKNSFKYAKISFFSKPKNILSKQKKYLRQGKLFTSRIQKKFDASKTIILNKQKKIKQEKPKKYSLFPRTLHKCVDMISLGYQNNRKLCSFSFKLMCFIQY